MKLSHLKLVGQLAARSGSARVEMTFREGRVCSAVAARGMATNKPSTHPLPESWVKAANKEIKADDADTKLLWHTAEGITIKVREVIL